MATSISQLVDQIDRELLVHYARPLIDTPSGSFNTSATSISLSTVSRLSAGAILDASFELMYVKSWSSPTATVIRGYLGTTAASGTTSTVVKINPRFTSVGILDAITDELRSWDERLFAVEQEALSVEGFETSWEVSPTVTPYRVLYVRPRPYTDVDVRTSIPMFTLNRAQNTSQFSSGYSLQIPVPIGVPTTVDVAYAVPFTLTGLSTSSDLIATHGLSESMLEILKWGALARLMAGKEASRLDPQSYSRPDVEQAVPALANMQASAQYQKMRDLAFDREVKKLLAQWPWKFN